MSEQPLPFCPYQKDTIVPEVPLPLIGVTIKIFEYMSSKRPIISSNLKVLKEVLIHKENRLLVNPENLDDWVLAIKLPI